MSNDEARQHKAMALLEFEEAKEQRTAARDAAWTMAENLRVRVRYLENARSDHFKNDPAALEEMIPHGALDLDAVVGMAGQLAAAEERFQEAQRLKKTFGLA